MRELELQAKSKYLFEFFFLSYVICLMLYVKRMQTI